MAPRNTAVSIILLAVAVAVAVVPLAAAVAGNNNMQIVPTTSHQPAGGESTAVVADVAEALIISRPPWEGGGVAGGAGDAQAMSECMEKTLYTGPCLRRCARRRASWSSTTAATAEAASCFSRNAAASCASSCIVPVPRARARGAE
uniref:Uncharacterized protein n=1 Tax=Oryza nivara TaxID=4536 RepID=A0A0E0GZS7_ORYNI